MTQLGIHHINDTNCFNLSCDFLEPLRPVLDDYVIVNDLNGENFKKRIVEILSIQVTFEGRKMFFDNAIHLYVQSLLTFMNSGDLSKVSFISHEF